jgi:uncharacterized phage infection (PIP) family protein YhgE
MKKSGRANDADFVKALTKPSVTAWAVNQLHWNHREEFDRLMAASQRLRQAQTAHTAGRIEDVRSLLDARREVLSELSDLATVLLRDAGHNPTPEAIHRITTTLEAVSAYATPSDGPTPGRLTRDVDPPGFESLASSIPGSNLSLASWIPAAGTTKRNEQLKKVAPSQKSAKAATRATQSAAPADDAQRVRQAEEARRAAIAAAKVALQQARKSLTEARSRAQHLESAQKKTQAQAKEADAEARQAEKQLRKAEEQYKKASAASQDAADRVKLLAAEAQEAALAVSAAERTIEKASKELESLT